MRVEPLPDDRGAAAVEFALLLPVLVLILFGIIEFGRGYNAKIAMTHAAREGARALALGKPTSTVKDTVIDAATPVALTAAEINAPTCAAGQPATVTIDHPFTYTIPMYGTATITIETKATMRCGG